MSVSELIFKIETYIIYPLIGLLFVTALLLFFWGGFQFIASAGSEEGRIIGKRHMLWGIIGMFVIFAATAILAVLSKTFGINFPP